jgi:hypothetical protein
MQIKIIITWAICNLQYELFLLSSLAWSRDNDRPAANETPWRQHTECVTMMLPLDCIRIRRWTPIKNNKAELMVSFDLNNNVSPITNWFWLFIFTKWQNIWVYSKNLYVTGGRHFLNHKILYILLRSEESSKS